MKITKGQAAEIKRYRDYLANEWKKNDEPVDQFINAKMSEVNATYFKKQTDMAESVAETQYKINRQNLAKKAGHLLPYDQNALEAEVDGKNSILFFSKFKMEAEYAVLHSVVKEQIDKRHWYDHIIHPFRTAQQDRAMDKIERFMNENGVTEERMEFLNSVYKGGAEPNGFTVSDKGKTVLESLEEIPDEDIDELDLDAEQINEYSLGNNSKTQVDMTKEVNEESKDEVEPFENKEESLEEPELDME